MTSDLQAGWWRNSHALIVHPDADAGAQLLSCCAACGLAADCCTTLPQALSHLCALPAADCSVVIFADNLHGLDADAVMRAVRILPECRDLPGIVLGDRPLQTRLNQLVLLNANPTAPQLHQALGNLLQGVSAHIEPDQPTPATVVKPGVPGSHSGTGQINGQPTIMLVEDNPTNQKLANYQLRNHAYNVLIAADGVEAVDVFQTSRIDLVLMDCQLPRMDGYQATRAIRDLEHDHGGHVPIIALTAHALAGEKAKCLDAGMDDYLSKPVSESELISTVKHWLCKAGVGNSNTAAIARPANAEPVAPATAAPAILDATVVARIQSYGDAVWAEISANFLRDLDNHMINMNSALHNNQSEPVGRAIHAVKGSSGSLGASRLQALATQIHQLAAQADLKAVRQLWPQLEACIASTRQAMQAVVSADAPQT